MDLVAWVLVPLVLVALLVLWAGGAGTRGVDVCLGDWPDDEAVLEGLDWYCRQEPANM